MNRTPILIATLAAVVSMTVASSASATHEDDEWLIFERTPPANQGTTQLFRIQVSGREPDLTGSGELKITHTRGGAFNPTASRRLGIVFNDPPASPARTGPRGLFKMNPLVGTPFVPKARSLSIPCEAACIEQFAPAVSPDGTKIAYLVAYGPLVDDAADHVDLVVANIDGSDQRVLRSSSWLRDGKEPTYTPTWSPDGGRLAFVDAYRDGRSALYVINSDGTGAHRLTRRADEVHHPARPAWSPRGDVIAFTLARASDRVPEIHTIRPDASDLKRLTVSPGNTGAWAPAWSANGSRIAFVRWDPAWKESDLWIMRRDGSGQTRIQRTRQNEAKPTWVPA